VVGALPSSPSRGCRGARETLPLAPSPQPSQHVASEPPGHGRWLPLGATQTESFMSGQFQVQVPEGLVPGQMFQVRKKQDDRRRATSERRGGGGRRRSGGFGARAGVRVCSFYLLCFCAFSEI